MNAGTVHLIGLIADSDIARQYLDRRQRVIDWHGLITDQRLSTGEMLVANLAYRVGRETGDIKHDTGHPVDLKAIDVISVLARVDKRYQKHVIEALWYMCCHGRTREVPMRHPLEVKHDNLIALVDDHLGGACPSHAAYSDRCSYCELWRRVEDQRQLSEREGIRR